jgi:hypothetical protein
MIRFFLGIIVLLAYGPLFAQGAATSGGDLFKHAVGVRPAAMAGTYAAFGDDVHVIGYNPAGLSRVAKYSLGVDHMQGLGDQQIQALSFSVPSARFGMFGGQIVYRHMPDIQNELALDPAVKAYDLALTFTNSRYFGKIAVGGSLKTLLSTLGDKKALATALDFGFKIPWARNDFSVVVQNLGPHVRYEPDSNAKDPLPLTFRLGVSRPIYVSPSATVLGGLDAIRVRDEGYQASLGVEYWHKSLIALRMGYRLSEARLFASGFSAGAGLRHGLGKLEYELGYAWKPTRIQAGYTQSSHLFGILFWF